MIDRAFARFVARSPWSTLVALLGVTLGVVSIVSVHMVSVQVGERVQAASALQFGDITHVLLRESSSARDYFELRRSWRAGKLDDRIERIAPFVDETTIVGGRAVRVIGIDLLSQSGREGSTRLVDLATAATASFAWDGVWISADLEEGAVAHPINGRLETQGSILIADIGVAHEILDRDPEHISYVGMEIEDRWAWLRQLLENVLPGSGAGLPERSPDLANLPGWQVTPIADVQPTSRFAQSILFNVSALASLAILVSWFLIYQVAVTWLRRLRNVFRRLHVLGVSNREIILRFLGCLGLLGVLASLIGLVVGWGLASWLVARAVGEAGVVLPLDGWIIAKATLSAVGVCIAGGGLAYRQQQAGLAPRLVNVLIAGLAAIALAGVTWTATGLAGAFAAIAALSFVATLTMRPVLDRLRATSRYLRGTLLYRLSVRELFWYPRDLSVALGGLVLAIATAIGVGLMVDSFRSDFASMLDRRLTYDIVVDGAPASLKNAVRPIEARRDVLSVQRYVGRDELIDGVRVEVTDVVVDAFEAHRYGVARALEADEILVSEQFVDAMAARDRNIEIGGVFAGATVAGVFRSFGDTYPRLIRAPVAADRAPTSLSLRLTQGADAAQLLASLRTRWPSLTFTDTRDLRVAALKTFDQTFTITSVLITIAMVVAATGIYIANQALRLNKAASSELLSVMGVTGRETWMMDLARSVGMGTVAVALALPLGFCFAWILCNVVNPRAFGWSIDLDPRAAAVAYPALWGILASVAAGLIRVGIGEEARFGDVRAAL
jgi:putative ABC transport system permease protein